ncbi:penicillin acylase family protein [Caulobacter sp. S45]|uniref:penicillin acylase family protein n=1 Tax=Caulobacter sp. S45 TaxID=1641861 RepID=UPI00131E6C87|nr:penicillin acylase family protein [Caulobacter sp. S45]
MRRTVAGLAVVLQLGLAGSVLAHPAHSAEVLWDRYGVPHVYAKTTADLFYGFGWAQIKSHGELMLKLYAEGRGKAAEYYGASELAGDRWMAINDVSDRSRAWLAAQTPEFRADLEAFADGMNAYAKAHPEALSAKARQVAPITGLDVVSYAHRLFQYVYLAPQAVAGRLPPDTVGASGAQRDDNGSNGWAIAPSRSASGKTMMLMNPHLPWGPSWATYYEAQLIAPGVNLYGATQVGLPVLRFVFSDQLGITNTVDNTNGVTFYKITPAPSGYMFDGKVLPFKTRQVVLKVLRPDGGFDTETVQVRSTVQGPVVGERGGAPIAMRVAGLDRPHALEQYWKMETAPDFAHYQAALRMMQVPTFNIIYGDKDGHIEYLFNGLVPRHAFGDLKYWKSTVPGDTSKTLWTGYLSYDELPKAIDPPGGVVQNSNDPPWETAFPSIIEPAPYKAYISRDALEVRMERGLQLLKEPARISFDQLLQKRWSTYMLAADRLLPDLGAAVRASNDDLAKHAMDVLDKWDRTADADSRGALLFTTWMDKLKQPDGVTNAGWRVAYDLHDPFSTPRGLADPLAGVQALDVAAKELLATQGALDAPWSKQMRLIWGGRNLPASGASGRYGVINVIDYGPAKDGVRTASFGATYVAVVSFDTPAKAKVLMSYGESSQPGSAHAGDQLPLLAQKQMRDAWRTRADIEANLESRDVF